MKTLLLKPNDGSVVEINGTCNFNTHEDKIMPWSLGVAASLCRESGDDVYFVDAMATNMTRQETRETIRRLAPDRIIATINPTCFKGSTAFHHELDAEVVYWINEPFTDWVKARSTGTKIVYGDWFSDLVGSTLKIGAYPFPAFDLMPMHLYNHQQTLASEGCRHRCVFCHFGEMLNRPWESRSIDNMLRELKTLRSYGLKFIRMFDNELATERDYAKALFRAIIRHKVDILWETNTRVSNLDEEMVALMARAGCVYTGYGIESADQRILDANRKEITLEQIRDASRLFKKHKILTRTYTLLGLRGSDEESIRKTFAFLQKDIESFDTTFDLVIPFPGTPYHRYLQDIGKLNAEVRPSNITWIEKNVYGNNRLYGEEAVEPRWQYDQISFAKACKLEWELRKFANTAGSMPKLAALLQKRLKGIRFLAEQFVGNPSGALHRLWG
jgi:pyruvate-formate lyase-activating enzyme